MPSSGLHRGLHTRAHTHTQMHTCIYIFLILKSGTRLNYEGNKKAILKHKGKNSYCSLKKCSHKLGAKIECMAGETCGNILTLPCSLPCPFSSTWLLVSRGPDVSCLPQCFSCALVDLHCLPELIEKYLEFCHTSGLV